MATHMNDGGDVLMKTRRFNRRLWGWLLASTTRGDSSLSNRHHSAADLETNVLNFPYFYACTLSARQWYTYRKRGVLMRHDANRRGGFSTARSGSGLPSAVGLSVGVVAIAATLILTVVAAEGKLTPAQKCSVAKQNAASKKATAKINCYAKTKFAAPPADTCLQKAESAFTKAFAAAEKPGTCFDKGDAAAVESSVDTMVAALVKGLDPHSQATPETPAQKCAVAKLKAAGKKAAAKIKCHLQNLSLSSSSLLTFCLSNAEHSFTDAISKAEAPGACATIGDAATLERPVDVFVNAIVHALVPPTPAPPTATPVPGAPPTATPLVTMCCDYFPGTALGECFDSIPSAIANRCTPVFGGTVEADGTHCSAGPNPACTSTRSVGTRCCSVPASGPNPNFCYEYTDPTAGDADCTTAFGGTILIGGSCDPVSGACSGSPPPPPSTLCCDSTIVGVCFDTAPSRTSTLCVSGYAVEAQGTFCDANVGHCGPAKTANVCCDGLPPPIPCIEFFAGNSFASGACTTAGGQLHSGVSCGPTSSVCGGP
jgi:hypothetical protein